MALVFKNCTFIVSKTYTFFHEGKGNKKQPLLKLNNLFKLFLSCMNWTNPKDFFLFDLILISTAADLSK